VGLVEIKSRNEMGQKKGLREKNIVRQPQPRRHLASRTTGSVARITEKKGRNEESVGCWRRVDKHQKGKQTPQLTYYLIAAK